MNWIIRIVIVGLLLAGAGGAYIAMKYVYNKNTAFNESQKMFFIKTGSSFDEVVKMAMEQGIIKDIDAFKWLAEKKKYTGKVRPGCYKIKRDMTNEQLVNLLRSGVQEPINVTFNNIRTVELLAGRIASQLEVDSISMYNYLSDSAMAAQYGFNARNFMSMFIPNTYQMYWNTTAEGFVKRMAREYKSFWNEKRIAKAREINLSHSEITTIASIVQEETRMTTDKPIIAGVYINRIKKGIPLEADPTLKFALKNFEIRRVLNADKLVESPYNTYKYAGIPPGPICIPDISTIDAVLNYAKHNYIFFCAKEDLSGYSNFAVTNSEHEANARRYQQALDKMNIKR